MQVPGSAFNAKVKNLIAIDLSVPGCRIFFVRSLNRLSAAALVCGEPRPRPYCPRLLQPPTLYPCYECLPGATQRGATPLCDTLSRTRAPNLTHTIPGHHPSLRGPCQSHLTMTLIPCALLQPRPSNQAKVPLRTLKLPGPRHIIFPET